MHQADQKAETGSGEGLKKGKRGQQPVPPKNEGDDSPNPLPDDLSELCPEGVDPGRP
jgi:hypothetical protein